MTDYYGEDFMNNLNSVLLEGEVSEAVQEVKGLNTFCIDSKSYYRKDDNTIIKKVETFRIVIKQRADTKESFNLVSVAKEKAKIGMNVRVVGKLRSKNNNVFIQAEHLEFRK